MSTQALVTITGEDVYKSLALAMRGIEIANSSRNGSFSSTYSTPDRERSCLMVITGKKVD